jgi:hypothetical protein
MPKPTSKSRQELRSRFVRNAIPTETDFADLIAASLNQADDGVLKLPDQPLGLVRQKPDQPVLRFFADPAAEGSVWQVQLGAGDKPGFGLAAADGKLALLVDGATGNVGIGTAIPAAKLDVQGDLKVSGCFTPSSGKSESSGILFPKDPGGGGGDAAWLRYYPNRGESCLLEIGIANDGDDHIALMPSGNVGIGTKTPGFKLDVNGTVRLGGFTTEEKDEWPNIVWCRDLDKGWDEGLIKHGKSNGFFGRAGFGIHIHESRSFEIFSSGWSSLLGIEGESGNTSIRGQTDILKGSNPIRFSSKWTRFPDDKTNGAEICNDTDYHKTLMIVGNKSNGGGRRVSIWDILEVGGSFQINNNGNTFKINTVGNKVEFFLAKSTHGDNRTISWDGDNNWDAPSDEKLKTNINIETGILPRLLQIDVKSFQWKDEPESKQKQLGFIAQDVRQAFPDLVKEKPFGDQSLLSLNYTNFGILAVGAIKELNTIMAGRFQELRNEIDLLKQRVSD